MEKIKNLGNVLRKKKKKTSEVGFRSFESIEKQPRPFRKKTQEKKFISKLIKFSPLLALAIIVFALLASPIFSVNNIVCKTQYSLCSDTDQKLLEDFKGKNLIFLKKTDVEAKITKSFANRKIVVQKIFPGTLSVFLERRKPVVSIHPANAPEGLFLVDSDGVIVEFAKTSSLPLITSSSETPFVVGESIDQSTLQAVKIMQLVYKSQKSTEGNLHDSQLDIRLPNGVLATFSLDRDPQVLVGALQLITARIRIDGKVPKSIDLRYSNPVLQY